jgi:hypothetical protein
MKVKSVELRDWCSVQPGLRTMNLLEDTHEMELQADGWVKWRLKGGQWHLSPPEMVRNVGLSEEGPTEAQANIISRGKRPTTAK